MNLLERRRILISMQNKEEEIILPSTYTKLNYIESTGTQWINPKYVCNSDYNPYRIKCKFRLTDTTIAQHIFGTNRGGTYMLQFFVDTAQNKFAFGRISTIGSSVRFAPVDKNIHELEYIFQKGAYFDKTFIEGSQEQASIIGAYSDRNIALFSRILRTAVDTNGMAKCQIFKFELYGENNEPQRILIPAQRKSDGKLGMYDMVTKAFFTNSGTGEFIGG